MQKIKNAIIENATINFERDILTAWLHVNYGGCGQGFGGYALMLGPDYAHRGDSELGPNLCGLFIEKVMRVAGVNRWEDLSGKTIRVDADLGKVHGIGHIVKDLWFYPTSAFDQLKVGAAA